MSFALRTDGSLDEVISWVNAQSFGGFAVKEVAGADNVHWHWLLESGKTLKQIRSSFCRNVPGLVGNKSYSLTVIRDVEKYARYMCKGDAEGKSPHVAWSNSLFYNDAKIEELHVEYWTNNKAMRKRKVGTVADAVIDLAKQDNVRWSDRQTLAKMYIQELKSRDKPINMYSVKSNLNLVQVALCPDDSAIEDLANAALGY